MNQAEQSGTPGNISPRSTIPTPFQQIQSQSVTAQQSGSTAKAGTVASKVEALNARAQDAKGSGPSAGRRASRATQAPSASTETPPTQKPNTSRPDSTSSTSGSEKARGSDLRPVKEVVEPLDESKRRRVSRLPPAVRQSYLNVPTAYIPAGSKHTNSTTTSDPWAWLPQGNEPLKVHAHHSKAAKRSLEALRQESLTVSQLLNPPASDPAWKQVESTEPLREAKEVASPPDAGDTPVQPLVISRNIAGPASVTSQTTVEKQPTTAKPPFDWAHETDIDSQGVVEAVQDFQDHFKKDVHDPVEQQMKGLIDLLDDAIANRSAQLAEAKANLSREVETSEATKDHDALIDNHYVPVVGSGLSLGAHRALNDSNVEIPAGQAGHAGHIRTPTLSRASSFHSTSNGIAEDHKLSENQHEQQQSLTSDGAPLEASASFVHKISAPQTSVAVAARTDKAPPGTYPPTEAHTKWFDMTGYFNRKAVSGMRTN